MCLIDAGNMPANIVDGWLKLSCLRCFKTSHRFRYPLEQLIVTEIFTIFFWEMNCSMIKRFDSGIDACYIVALTQLTKIISLQICLGLFFVLTFVASFVSVITFWYVSKG